MIKYFFVPQLASQIYRMSGMVTRLHLQADYAGLYPGLSAMFSGDRFSDMRFSVDVVASDGFGQWARQAWDKAVAPFSYRAITHDLFRSIVNDNYVMNDGEDVGLRLTLGSKVFPALTASHPR
ncbi:hypothetical protein QIH85_12185 [Bradyrhizobium japonicum]|uniref:hypothetical protein n=1 Tax=Bradyrhizobium japonicum TaxID=375 RepID=UPI001E2E7F7B|nr:hypothetical protein [Bradyrhizobium japonicum]MCD9260359.1 hypothetical protein [Bradyrhizobium japonicum SEMIA 5079]MCD9113034.1 hypothetical protein [Bradyrhizobium japonicum]MCD9825170.1 hypothetical protein [Bradyrhizobium japonicum]MCD9898094.1 hypothetical protein [Bradyrhizobium japonicum]MCD9913277.1 hypothetical protein [Bradyrhizobium japonicum]